MRPEVLSKRNLLLASLGGLALVLTLFFHLSPPGFLAPKSPLHSNSAPVKTTLSAPKSVQASFGLPVRLKIPKINIDAAVVDVGTNTDGEMGTPKSLDDVAWYDLGQRPGETGSAVITGHYGGNSIAAVFNDLAKLQIGDKLYVVDENGATTTFAVVGSQSYNPSANASAVFSSSDGKSHLNLVTCEGVWNIASQSYPQRLVVFADKQ